MKRIIAIPILLIYFVAVTGAIINLHYCGGKLFSMKMNNPVACCCKASAGKNTDYTTSHYSIRAKDSCCSNAVIAFKISSQQLHVSDYQLTGLTADITPALLPHTRFEFANSYFDTQQLFVTNPVHAPPGLWQDIPLYKLHQRFILYS